MAHLGLEPYLNMGMRLGEGSGAALAMPIVEAACAMYHRMGMLAASNIVLPKGKQEMGAAMAVPVSAEVLPAAEKNTLEGVCNVGCGGRI